MTTLAEIEQHTKAFADARDVLSARVQDLEAELESIKRRRLRGIKHAVRAAQEARDRLHAAIEAAPELFVKPRTLVISGIRVGIQKGKGQIVFDDPEQVVRLIRKHLPEQADALVAVKETPVKKALSNLSVAELKRIGVTVEETGDQVVIKPTDSEVDKLVAALLKEAERYEEVAA
jgi:hypothetical protein